MATDTKISIKFYQDDHSLKTPTDCVFRQFQVLFWCNNVIISKCDLLDYFFKLVFPFVNVECAQTQEVGSITWTNHSRSKPVVSNHITMEALPTLMCLSSIHLQLPYQSHRMLRGLLKFNRLRGGDIDYNDYRLDRL